ncbi:sigma-54-dependent transcriptional regulator [Candidatus Methylomicrobium oryzae]|jgi:two-component system response regulator PilR (NtrC family)|uniref:sigma-54-dependent transcriptional regulator n=1 Tax=Candidatus Methylomicrobium oryzae TaxID=2802053 RepID=UPI0019225655|nr:sigma-54 dependent transcriptional regulator [Methylomicrobium sp. RS1]MBL1264765.1 sigma-54-dependent Fis family transcriptional regulator [Methylomicrobium sp. RS1]
MKTPFALIVDDEPDIIELLEITLNRMGVETRSAGTASGARQLLQERTFDLCLTDLKLPDGDGLELVELIQSSDAPPPVAVITAHGNMDTAITAMKKGAFDFVSKPVDLLALRQLVANALKFKDNTSAKDRRMRHTLLGESQLMRDIRSKIAKLARSQAPVYIHGESGAGKELVARLIHQQSTRSDKSFVAINCGAIPHELMESEFFGHKKGSFTGAVSDKKGLFQAADGGTLFLDEIADLPPSLQVKLLRAIQEKKIRPVGEQQEIPVDVRLLSATHRNLAEMVQNGNFRQDLFYRINVIELNVPPLRERTADVPVLVEHILVKLTEQTHTHKPEISQAALEALLRYRFPGNIRELENILERALALYDGKCIEVDDLNLPIGIAETHLSEESRYDPGQGSLEDYLEAIERRAILHALEENRWNKTAAAKQLGLTFRSFRYRLKKLELDD